MKRAWKGLFAKSSPFSQTRYLWKL